MKKICVIASLNTDLVVSVERFPQPGETITGKEFGTFPGGKGANQAVAASRLGADVRIVGKVGDDLYGKKYVETLKDNGIDFRGLGVEQGCSSGIAVIEVDDSGENHIVYTPGANAKMDMEFIEDQWDYMQEADIFLIQLEIPLKTVLYTIRRLHESGKTVILDPAPARKLPDEIFNCIDYITPNETEIEILTGIKVDCEDDCNRAARCLLDKGVRTVIAKAGKDGAYIANENEFIHIPGFKVNPIDTTAAGDSFNAGFAFALAKSRTLTECVRIANAVGALSTTAKGAQSAMPTWKQVLELLGE
jgi:ribokinase